jgi:hypothetical protein
MKIGGTHGVSLGGQLNDDEKAMREGGEGPNGSERAPMTAAARLFASFSLRIDKMEAAA